MTQNVIYSFSAPAAANLSDKQFLFLKMDNTGAVAVAGDGELVCGVLQNTPDAAGKSCTVGHLGIAKVKAGGAITAGAVVASDGTGKAVAAGSGKGGAGIAMETAAENDLVRVLLMLGPGQGM